MKKLSSLLLCAAILLCLTGCQKQQGPVKPINFYYRYAGESYEADSAAIRSQIREGKDYTDFLEPFLAYLQGSTSDGYINPFPENLRLIAYEIYENTLYLTFSNELATLSGLDLTIACCCITLTCLELTDAVNVNISAENAMLGGEKSITFNRDTIMLLDFIQ